MDKPRKGKEQTLTLQPDEYNLEIHFSSLDYLNAAKIRYAYRMIGLDKNGVTQLPDNMLPATNIYQKESICLK